jgi:hypothetical protein
MVINKQGHGLFVTGTCLIWIGLHPNLHSAWKKQIIRKLKILFFLFNLPQFFFLKLFDAYRSR